RATRPTALTHKSCYRARKRRFQMIDDMDNSSTHKGDPLDEFQRQHPRLRIEHFPSYAPELNMRAGRCASKFTGKRITSMISAR
ncbi:MAG: hypothetical protein AAB225_14110, partial [Acidobacteriota bacterium]